MGIIHALTRHVLDLLAPGSGKRRGTTRPAVNATARAEASRAAPSSLPTHRSPYGLHPLLDGASTVMVRPYLDAGERKRECARRSRTRGRTSTCQLSPPQARQLAEVR